MRGFALPVALLTVCICGVVWADAPVAKAFVWPQACKTCDPGAQNWVTYPHGDVTIVDRNGVKRQITRDGMNRDARVSPDRCTVGWLTGGTHTGGEHGETVLLTSEVALWRGGAVLRTIHRDGFILDWQFWNGGKQVAIASGPIRDVRFFSLYDVATGERLKNQPRFDADGHETVPRWAQALMP